MMRLEVKTLDLIFGDLETRIGTCEFYQGLLGSPAGEIHLLIMTFTPTNDHLIMTIITIVLASMI